MNVLLVLLSAAFIGVCQCSFQEDWISFKKRFGKVYEDPSEDQRRMLIFQKTVDYIQEHNRKFLDDQVSFTMAVTEYADLTDEEFESTYLIETPPSYDDEVDVPIHDASDGPDSLPESVDWRTKGYVTPMKYQGECSSYWAFSTIGSLEGQHFRKTGQLLTFSEQNLLDCSSNFKYGNNGCNGGYMHRSFKYIMKNGINTEDTYPYELEMKKCRFNKDQVATNITGYVRVRRDSQRALKDAVANIGPISVGLEVYKSFRYYEDGIYYDAQCGTGLQNHAAVVVGYGSEDGKDYWLVKNSWGTYWGNQGYIKMIRNFPISCGVVRDATYPTM